MLSKYTMQAIVCPLLLLLYSCKSEPEDDYIPQTKPKSAEKLSHTYSVFIENSLSINGYLNLGGDSCFKSNVFALLSDINAMEDKSKLALYDINTTIIAVDTHADANSLNAYNSRLDAATFKTRSKSGKGNQSKSDLLQVFKNILDTAQLGDVTILITDGIFSPEQRGDARQFLSTQQYGLQNLFSEKLRKKNFATLIMQFHADFQGIYYYQDNTNKSAFFKDRPYYIVGLGEESALRRLHSKVTSGRSYKGYRAYLLMSPASSYDVSPAVRDYEDYYVYDHEQPLTVTEGNKSGRDNKFRIKLRVDFSALPVSEAYLNKPENYHLSLGYTLESIKPQEQGKGTHELILVAAAPKTGLLSLSLKRTLPQWVTNSHLDDDRQLSPMQLEGKTFGIRYLLSGLYDAYYHQQASPYYYTISISVKE